MKKYIKRIIIILIVIASVITIVLSVIDSQNESLNNNTNQNTQREESDTVTTAIYKVRLSSQWTTETHPTFAPEGTHLSPMVGWTSKNTNPVFSRGENASAGIKEMAETGGTDPLKEELENLKERGTINEYEIGEVFFSPGEQEFEIVVNKETSIITVVSMIAPSPDWFISAHNIALYDNQNGWVSYREEESVLYDAGTDSGEEFTAEDVDTNPKEPITYFKDAPSKPIGIFEFTRIQ